MTSQTCMQNLPIIPSSGNFSDNHDQMNDISIPVNVPTHPIPRMQSAFVESYLESHNSTDDDMTNRPKTALARRQQLLEQGISVPTHAARWRLKPGQKNHELWKIMSQISFGVYILLYGIARDEEQVMKILQVHVHQVDEFLESALEDFSLAQHDIEHRLKNLKLPLRNISIFEILMEDRSFRLQIVEGNEKIEHVIVRTASAMNDALEDVQQGIHACKEFGSYIENKLDHLMLEDKENQLRIYKVMKGNIGGWYNAFDSLQEKATQLDSALVQLGSIIAELARIAGEVSRKNRFSAIGPPTHRQSLLLESRISRQMHQSLAKGLQSSTTPPSFTAEANSPQELQNKGCEAIPEIDSVALGDKPPESDPELILKPKTYSPATSSRPSCTSIYFKPGPGEVLNIEMPPPRIATTNEAPPHLSLQDCLSISFAQALNVGKEQDDLKDGEDPCQIGLSNTFMSGISSGISTIKSQTPTSHGLDSVSSDFEKKSSQIFSPMLKLNIPHEPLESPITSQSNNSRESLNSCHSLDSDHSLNSNQSKNSHHSHYSQCSEKLDHVSESNQNDDNSNPQNFSCQMHLPPPQTNYLLPESHQEPNPLCSNLLSPSSVNILDKQNLRPVNASPHSPLQQLWTASVSQNPLHTHQNSSSSNISYYSSYSNRIGNSKVRSEQYSHHPSNRFKVKSSCGESVRSEMIPNRRIKEKRSVFQWLKDQFSLNEEEKRNFQEKIKPVEKSSYSIRNMERASVSRKQIWVDGKRIRESKAS